MEKISKPEQLQKAARLVMEAHHIKKLGDTSELLILLSGMKTLHLLLVEKVSEKNIEQFIMLLVGMLICAGYVNLLVEPAAKKRLKKIGVNQTSNEETPRRMYYRITSKDLREMSPEQNNAESGIKLATRILKQDVK